MLTKPHLEGADLGLIWTFPFIGILLSIALFPLLAPAFWHRHFGKVAFFWSAAFLVPFILLHSIDLALYKLLHVFLLEYIPFVLLLLTLFVTASGVYITGSFAGTPRTNSFILLIGATLASWIGTTGAAMLLIHPLLRANSQRRYRAHSVIFFIFLVANIGGALTPLGDPPLFLGFLNGVSFFWTTSALLPLTLFCVAILIALYFILDSILYAKEGRPKLSHDRQESLGIKGKRNLLLISGVVATVIMSGYWRPGFGIEVYHVSLEAQEILRDVLLIIIALASLVITKKENRHANGFSWFPIIEVAKLFAGIFVTIIPAIAILRAGEAGALRDLIALTSHDGGQPDNIAYFWLTGLLSSMLDNAPTYLVFFNTAGGDAEVLMGPMYQTLLAISAGAVLMGANTYIGNAPNFMVRSIAVDRGVPDAKLLRLYGLVKCNSVTLIFPCDFIVYLIIL